MKLQGRDSAIHEKTGAGAWMAIKEKEIISNGHPTLLIFAAIFTDYFQSQLYRPYVLPQCLSPAHNLDECRRKSHMIPIPLFRLRSHCKTPDLYLFQEHIWKWAVSDSMSHMRKKLLLAVRTRHIPDGYKLAFFVGFCFARLFLSLGLDKQTDSIRLVLS